MMEYNDLRGLDKNLTIGGLFIFSYVKHPVTLMDWEDPRPPG